MPTTIQRRAARRPTGALTVVAALALMIVSAVPAQATIIDRDRYDVTIPPGVGYDDCGYAVSVEGTVRGRYHIREGKGKTDTAFFLKENVSYSEIHTNLETGDFVRIEGRLLFNEVRATHVAGSVFEFTTILAGQPFVVYDSAGELVLRDRGMAQSTVLFDTEGDDAPGGIEIDVQTVVRGPQPSTDLDFCTEILDPLIGS